MATKYLDEGGLTTLVGQTKTYVTNSLPNEMIGATTGMAGTAGLVPAPSAGDNEKFLRGDATWQTVDVSVMTGATSTSAGKAGKVPAPGAGEQEKYLKADGTWSELGSSITYSSDEPSSKSTDMTWVDL